MSSHAVTDSWVARAEATLAAAGHKRGGARRAVVERVCEHEEHHHHLVCDSCGLVMPFSDIALEQAIETLSERVPLKVVEHEIVLHGSCQDCAA
jgi:hypothetical protein